jgi:hypothetical protein
MHSKIWASRASRRKQRERYRLAFVASKFRIGQEPEPFVLEVDLSREPWTVTDVTGDVDRAGEEARTRKAVEKAARLGEAAEKLVVEIGRRAASGEGALRKRQDAEPFLQAAGLTRREARDLLSDGNGRDWMLLASPSDGRVMEVLPLSKNGGVGHNSTLQEPAQTLSSLTDECGRAHPMRAATFDEAKTPIKSGDFEQQNVAADSIYTPPGKQESTPVSGPSDQLALEPESGEADL